MSGKEKLAILLWLAPLDQPELLRAPFVYAVAAAAMDAEVEIHFSGRTVRLLVADAENQEIKGYMKDVAAEGVRFLGCSTALKRHVREGEKMIAEYAGAAGAASYAQRALDPEWRTLVF
ncbi:MAG TPA: DsrE family protein [Burkholderiales bacterium]|nr:DsrE family protein [Burkholderiales bacterium]